MNRRQHSKKGEKDRRKIYIERDRPLRDTRQEEGDGRMIFPFFAIRTTNIPRRTKLYRLVLITAAAYVPGPQAHQYSIRQFTIGSLVADGRDRISDRPRLHTRYEMFPIHY